MEAKQEYGDWNGELLEHGPAQLEFRGVTFAFDSVYVDEGTFMFTYDGLTTTKIDEDDVPDCMYEWLGEVTDGFGNVQEQ